VTRLRALAARRPKTLAALLVLVLGPVLAHACVAATTRIEPLPAVAAGGEPTVSPGDPDLRVLGPAYARHRGKILEVRLAGSPEEIGHQHGRLLYPEMVEDEGTLYTELHRVVPFAPARMLLVDLARWQYRRVDRGMAGDRLREIAALAAAFSPDPFEGFLPTYHRFVFLQSLYDIALSFEHSPLIGCTSFALTGGAAEGGHVVLARNFDFEAGPVFDEKKTVFLVRERGRIPYASVAWPGLAGVVSGMNAEGVAIVVHGGRARAPRTLGEPVVQTIRDLLGRAPTTREAIAILEHKQPMVSHILMIADAGGDVAIVERAPGEPPFVRRGSGKVPLTNHFEGPLADDPKNQAVLAVTTTRPRRRRLDELLAALPAGATAAQIVGVLRDRRGAGGAPLALGDRRAIDALIATHSVVMDATARVMWVSEGPHLVGRYVRFDLGTLLAPAFEPAPGQAVEALPEDPILRDGAYDAWARAGAPHHGEP
jgi:hypothetical protein